MPIDLTSIAVFTEDVLTNDEYRTGEPYSARERYFVEALRAVHFAAKFGSEAALNDFGEEYLHLGQS